METSYSIAFISSIIASPCVAVIVVSPCIAVICESFLFFIRLSISSGTLISLFSILSDILTAIEAMYGNKQEKHCNKKRNNL